MNTPIDQVKLKKCIMLALSGYNWNVTSDEEGKIYARYSKSDELIILDIEIVYDEDSYEINYVDSKNLDANLKNKKIHKSYARWTANLNKAIYTNYIENM